jgi:hypothetical protein
VVGSREARGLPTSENHLSHCALHPHTLHTHTVSLPTHGFITCDSDLEWSKIIFGINIFLLGYTYCTGGFTVTIPNMFILYIG